MHVHVHVHVQTKRWIVTTYIKKIAESKGKRIVDAKDGLFLEVTERDIKKARMGDSRACGFVQCIKRQEPCEAAYVFRSVAYIETDEEIVRYELPPSMQKEVVAFDRSKAMVPGEYRLSPPSKTNTLKDIRSRKKTKRGGPFARGKGAKTANKPRYVHRAQGVRSAKDPQR